MRTRREFISGFSQTALALAVFSAVPGTPAAYAIAPAAAAAIVVALVQTAVAIAGLFSGNGGISDLLKLQVEMLAHISEQLRAIEDGIIFIIKRLDEIEGLIGQVPREVDWRLHQSEIAGASGRWRTLLPVYEQDRRQGHFDPINAPYKSEMENILFTLSQAAHALMDAYSDYRLVPSICFASFIECQARIIVSQSTLQTTCKAYRDWLTKVSQGSSENTLQGAIAKLEKEKEERNTGAKSAEDYYCAIYKKAIPARLGQPIIGSYQQLHAVSTLVPLDKATDDLGKAADDMIKRGAMTEKDRPLQVRVDITALQKPTPFAKGGLPPGTYPAQLVLCAEKESKRRNAARDATAAMADNAAKLIWLRSLEYDANKALRFLARISGAAARQ